MIAKYGVEETATYFPEFESIRSSLYKNKRKIYPKLPTNLDELIISDDFCVTEEGKRFLLADLKDDNERIIIATYNFNFILKRRCEYLVDKDLISFLEKLSGVIHDYSE
jgi:hypothetical protein